MVRFPQYSPCISVQQTVEHNFTANRRCWLEVFGVDINPPCTSSPLTELDTEDDVILQPGAEGEKAVHVKLRVGTALPSPLARALHTFPSNVVNANVFYLYSWQGLAMALHKLWDEEKPDGISDPYTWRVEAYAIPKQQDVVAATCGVLAVARALTWVSSTRFPSISYDQVNPLASALFSHCLASGVVVQCMKVCESSDPFVRTSPLCTKVNAAIQGV